LGFAHIGAQINIAEQRRIMLDELSYVDEVCRSNGIESSLMAGSLLGAIRHGGFIPWDDDIDIALRKDEYNRLIDILAKDESPHYRLYHYKAMPAYHPYAKLYDDRTLITSKWSVLVRGTGVFIDIFPYYVVPDDDEERKGYYKELERVTVELAASAPHGLDYASGPSWKSFLYSAVMNLPAHIKYRGHNREVAERLDRLQEKYLDSDNKMMGAIGPIYGDRERFPREIFDEYEDVEFEGRTVRKIKNHDACLRSVFGDYMQLPPENQRHTHSYYKYFWKDSKGSSDGSIDEEM
jgi:lipopolysaccharide cholinephosphotransferase